MIVPELGQYNMVMKFFLQKGSSASPQDQLHDQIKFAIGVGRLRPGDALPSVRELEEEIGLGKNTIWRVYQQLGSAGLLTLRQGQGARVNSEIPEVNYREKLQQCELLCRQTEERALKWGINPVSFGRYYQQYIAKENADVPSLIFAECNKTETELFANQISDAWGIEVAGIPIDNLHDLVTSKRVKRRASVLTNLYHIEEVRGILHNTPCEVIGLHFIWDRKMLRAIDNLKSPANALFVFNDGDLPRYGNLVSKEFMSLVGKRQITLALKEVSKVGDLGSLCKSKKYDHIFFSNRLWHQVPPQVRKFPFVGRPTLRLDPRSLESARAMVGAIW